MRNKKSKFNEYAKFMRPFAILLVMIILLTATTWAWVRREWAPYLSSGENGMSIATTDALVFNMDVTDSGDDQLASSKTINAILNVNHFELKPVSNATGMSDAFYKINYGNTQEEYTFINIGNGISNMEIGKENGYVDITFWVQGSGSTKTQYVYLHKDSHIGTPGSLLKDSEKAIRVAITAGSQTYLFSAEGNRAKDDGDFYPYKAVSKAGPVYVEKDGELVWNQSCISQLGADAFKTFDAYNGYDENNNKDYGKCLFTVSGQERVAIRVKIWLEGEDELCDEHIISDFIDLMIKFTAYSSEELINE
ncbi:MAG: hypothetical protein IKV38_00525 [Clostridia bacterium]|nr:hypothetical protein [Clostridia bacterium]